jgi:hypothetical protein
VVGHDPTVSHLEGADVAITEGPTRRRQVATWQTKEAVLGALGEVLAGEAPFRVPQY